MEVNSAPAARRIDRIEEGFYKARLVSKGPWSPARIVKRASQPDRSPVLVCLVAGEEFEAERMWPFLTPISEEEYARLCVAMADPRRAFQPSEDIPDFGQPDGANSRDAALCAAARHVLAEPTVGTITCAERVAQLVRAIIAERDGLETGFKAAVAPLRAKIEEQRREYACAAEEHRPALLAWLEAWMTRAGAEKIQASNATAHWHSTAKVEIRDEKCLPREFLVPDERAIAAALKAGRKVRGAGLVTTQSVRVM